MRVSSANPRFASTTLAHKADEEAGDIVFSTCIFGWTNETVASMLEASGCSDRRENFLVAQRSYQLVAGQYQNII